MKKHCIIIMATLSLAAITGGCAFGGGITIGSVEQNTPTKMSMSYSKFDGYRKTTIKVEENQPVTVMVAIVSEKGSLDAYIALDNDQAITAYEGHNIPTSSFVVTLNEPGNYTLRVDANDHKGSYAFNWGE